MFILLKNRDYAFTIQITGNGHLKNILSKQLYLGPESGFTIMRYGLLQGNGMEAV